MNFNSMNVIVLDDHPVVHLGIEAVLVTHPNIHLKGAATSLKELLPLLYNTRADILLLDLNIPGEDYIKTVKKLRSNFKSLRIIAYTAYNDPNLVKSLLGMGVNGYLLKDAEGEEITEALESVFKGEFFIGHHVQTSHLYHERDRNKFAKRDDFQKRLCLSRREQEILVFISKGFTSQNIGDALFISKHTVETHRKNILRKLDFNSSAEVVKFAVQQGLV
ncbi:MAG: response regulator transcription factor [Bacteroidetes bacterium]|nr:response regulator transcription factor [Bacteroidota bacterium]